MATDLAIVTPTTTALLTVERARDMLATCHGVDEVRKIADQADLVAVYLRQRDAAMDLQNEAVEIGIWARRRLGELTREMPRTPGSGRGKSSTVRGSKGETLAAMGLSSGDVSRYEALADAPEWKIEKHVAGVRARAEKLTARGTIAAVSHAGDYDSDDWGTEPEIVELVRSVLGEIDLDPASSKHHNKVVKAKRIHSLEDDGLTKPWCGRIFLNPPYKQPACERFVERFITEQQAGRLKSGIIVLNASTDTAWWHRLAEIYPVCLTKGRRGFLMPDGSKADANRVGQAFFAAGCGRQFQSRFEAAGVGITMTRAI